MLCINHLSFTYSRRKPPVLSDFSLKFSEGGVYGLLGSNGAGKSTLLYLMAGLLTPTAGDVTLDGIVTRRRLPQTQAEIFLVPEEFDLPSLSIRRYAELNGALYPNFSPDDMLENLKIFEIDPEMDLSKISMGQKKKAFLSFAMACNTKVLILDEPTNGLDIPGKSAFRRYIARSMSDDRIIVISTHQVRDVNTIIDHVAIIDDSRLLFNRNVADIQSKLRFSLTSNPEVIAKAIYSEPGIGSAAVIMENSGDNDETELNLEMLFSFAHQNPQLLNSLFKS